MFTMEQNASRLWVFPFDAAAGRVMGAGKPLTSEDSVVTASALTPDGSMAAYTLTRAGSRSIDLWVVDVNSGESVQHACAFIRPDCQWYSTRETLQGDLHLHRQDALVLA